MIYNLSIILFVLIVSYITGKFLVRLSYFNFLFSREGRYGGIDGLRGYLALFVFVDHFIIMWYWQQGREWGSPPETYINNMGNVGVMIFFMITGFLFTSKIIRDKGQTNWYKLYKSRIFRIYPLYLASLIVITLIVFYQSNFTLHQEIILVVKQYIKWFFYLSTPINNFPDTRIINAGVDWTLKYEWLFYLSLPLIALSIRLGKWAIITFTLFTFILYLQNFQLIYIHTHFLIFFIVGALVAYLNTIIKPIYLKKIDSFLYSFFSLGLLLFAMAYPHTYDPIQIIAASAFFTLVVFGNTLFGLLKHKTSIFLGEISYSIYLLHAIVLYIIFILLKVINIKTLSLETYEIMMPLLAITVIIISTIAHVTIELPGIRYGKK